jgi:HD-like signal output (HDOD) protein/CheY-like chemotaxis protein
MTTIVFVDDDTLVLQGLRRMLRTNVQDWKLHFVAGGPAALAFLDANAVDIVVSDMRMPDVDGAQVLAHARQRWPEAARIVLSGHSDREHVVRSLHESHQYMAKPLEAAQLLAVLHRAVRVRKLRSSHGLARVGRLDHLPSLPKVYQQISAEMRQESGSMKSIGALIGSDPGLSAKVVQLANSAFFGLPRHVQSPVDAAVMLGLDVLRTIVLNTSLVTSLPEGLARAAKLEEMAAAATESAALARKLAQAAGADRRTADLVFLASSLKDVGHLVLLSQQPDAYLKWHHEGADPAAEAARFGLGHQEAGALLLGLWGLPDEVVEAVLFHHGPVPSEVRQSFVAVLTHLADRLVSPGAEVDPALLSDPKLAAEFTALRQRQTTCT